jgi:hypothetical protein
MITRSISARFLFTSGIALIWLLAGNITGELSNQGSAPAASPAPIPVSRQEVWQAVADELREQGLSDEQLPGIENLELPKDLPALPGRRLRVSSACWEEGSQRAQFRLQCGEPGQCLPFLVYVNNYLPSALTNSLTNSAPGHNPPNRGGRAQSCRLASKSNRAAGTRLVAGSAPSLTPKPAVRTGEHASAVFISRGMRMTASVTCLERGREGEVVRVRGLDGHIFRARISGPARLEALPQ